MSGVQGKLRKRIGLNFTVIVLLLFASGLTLSACQNVKIGPSANEKSTENQSGKSGKKLNKNQSENSAKKKSDKKSNPEQEDTRDDQDLDK
jgi:flagellum-specific peptidoglycan hydrolase FlgJ